MRSSRSRRPAADDQNLTRNVHVKNSSTFYRKFSLKSVKCQFKETWTTIYISKALEDYQFKIQIIFSSILYSEKTVAKSYL